MILLSRNSHKTLIQGRETTFPVTFGKYLIKVETQSLEMPGKRIFSSCAEALRDKTGSNTLIGHAMCCHGNVNVKNTISTRQRPWPSLILITCFLLKIDHPHYFLDQILADPVLNIPEHAEVQLCGQKGI